MITQERVVVPTMQWTLLITAVSFAMNFNDASEWVDDGMKRAMSVHAQVLSGASGLAGFMFAVEKKEYYQTAVGKLWSFTFAQCGMFHTRVCDSSTAGGKVKADGGASHGATASRITRWSFFR